MESEGEVEACGFITAPPSPLPLNAPSLKMQAFPESGSARLQIHRNLRNWETTSSFSGHCSLGASICPAPLRKGAPLEAGGWPFSQPVQASTTQRPWVLWGVDKDGEEC